MTIRERFNRRKRRLLTVAALGAVGSSILFAFAKQNPLMGILAFLSFLVSFVAIMWGYQFAFRCPACGGALGNMAMQSASFCDIDSNLRFCPYCGVDLDLEEVEKPAEGAEWE